ncbi:MAG: ribosome biogenesis factor YjgA [Pseudohongiellaceae bacterium]
MSEIEDDDKSSKSHRKREADAMQALGKKLTELKEVQLAELALNDKVLDAVNEYNRLPNSHGAKRRQLQFIGRVMRDNDSEAIAAKLEKVLSSNYQSEKNLRKALISNKAVEILENGDEGITRVISDHPSLDRQQLRQINRDFGRANPAKKQALRSKLEELLRNISPS